MPKKTLCVTNQLLVVRWSTDRLLVHENEGERCVRAFLFGSLCVCFWPKEAIAAKKNVIVVGLRTFMQTSVTRNLTFFLRTASLRRLAVIIRQTWSALLLDKRLLPLTNGGWIVSRDAWSIIDDKVSHASHPEIMLYYQYPTRSSSINS